MGCVGAIRESPYLDSLIKSENDIVFKEAQEKFSCRARYFKK